MPKKYETSKNGVKINEITIVINLNLIIYNATDQQKLTWRNMPLEVYGSPTATITTELK